jgi:GTPase Era involved in 16S rRNA processing
MSTKNIVLFGETGAGKSSVVNLMAGEEIAKTSPSTERCTMHWKKYPITFDGHNYNVFDTMGLEEPQLKIEEYLDAIVNARSLIMKLKDEGGIDLLLFCVRAGGRFTSTIQNNYRLFYEWLCEKKFPIVLVLTGLENELNMEDRWTKCKVIFDRYNIVVEGHACITAANKLDGRHQELYEESRRLVRNLVKEHTHDRRDGTSKGDERWKEGGRLKGGGGWFIRLSLGKHRALNTGNATFLIKRCGMPPEAARQLTRQIR